MSGSTLGQIKKKLPIPVSTFKTWEGDKIPHSRRIKKGTQDVRVFSENEVSEYIDIIQKVQNGEKVSFDKERNIFLSPFPLPNGSPHS